MFTAARPGATLLSCLLVLGRYLRAYLQKGCRVPAGNAQTVITPHYASHLLSALNKLIILYSPYKSNLHLQSSLNDDLSLLALLSSTTDTLIYDCKHQIQSANSFQNKQSDHWKRVIEPSSCRLHQSLNKKHIFE